MHTQSHPQSYLFTDSTSGQLEGVLFPCYYMNFKGLFWIFLIQIISYLIFSLIYVRKISLKCLIKDYFQQIRYISNLLSHFVRAYLDHFILKLLEKNEFPKVPKEDNVSGYRTSTNLRQNTILSITLQLWLHLHFSAIEEWLVLTIL